ncbi:MAG: flavin reductase [Candidatus Omnitrophica bacterium]|nr:flavin reductase [Candidatus Omnitrophota bacterium]
MDKKTLYKISYGMYVVSSKKENKFNGQIANTVFQVTAEPPQVSVCINKENLTHQFIQESKVFTISILERDAPMKFIGHFGFKSGKELEKFKDIDYKLGMTGAPIVIQNCLGYLECEVTGSMNVGTHTIFIGKVIEAQLTREGESLTYAYYHQVKNGKSPKNAPTHIREGIESKEENKMAKYKCTVCGYIYDLEKGDPDSGVSPGIPFENLPNDWVCPVCGAGKDKFEKIS